MDRGRQGEPPDVLSHPVEFVEWLWDEDEQQDEQQDEDMDGLDIFLC